MVQLKAVNKMLESVNQLNFNSNMVQLKERSGIKKPEPLQKFQFQYGTIKRPLAAKPCIYSPLFQFQYGTIKRKM